MDNGATDKSQLNDLQSLLCATLQSVLRKMTKEDVPLLSDTIMTALLQVGERRLAELSQGNGKLNFIAI